MQKIIGEGAKELILSIERKKQTLGMLTENEKNWQEPGYREKMKEKNQKEFQDLLLGEQKATTLSRTRESDFAKGMKSSRKDSKLAVLSLKNKIKRAFVQ